VGLHRPGNEPGAGRHPSPEPRGTVALQRPAQPRLRLLVQQPPGLGHRDAGARARRIDDDASAACASRFSRRRATRPRASATW
jgi:hypothetical protein